MNAACESVLARLNAAKRNGITFDDFPRGFRLGARIFDLRQDGFVISTIKEPIGSGTRARYVLMGKGGSKA